jgi:hypothetical protein
MNGWLVLAICNLDDIPVQFCETKDEAVRLASTLKPPEDNPLVTWDLSDFIGAKVLEFRDGHPFGTAMFFDPVEEE